MAVTGEKLPRHELIGLRVKVTRSSNPLHVGIKGVVVDETENTLVIADNSRRKRVPKENATYCFTTSNGTFIEIEGERLLDRPADRIGRTSRRRRS